MKLYGLKISKGHRAPKFKVKIGFLLFWITIKRFNVLQDAIVYREKLRNKLFIDRTLDV